MKVWQNIVSGICLGIAMFSVAFTVYCGINYFCGNLSLMKLDDRMIEITEKTGLYYDLSTNVVYYYKKGDCMCPFYTKDGNLARYLDGEIVEIKEYEAMD